MKGEGSESESVSERVRECEGMSVRTRPVERYLSVLLPMLLLAVSTYK